MLEHYYFSGYSNPGVEMYMQRLGCKRLISMAYEKELSKVLSMAEELGLRLRLMIDSGAFTAWNSGHPMELDYIVDKYTDIWEQNKDKHDVVFITLDDIPGERGRLPTGAEIKQAVLNSQAWFLELQELGMPILPVYHSGEDRSVKHFYMEHTDYICLSMNQTMSAKMRAEWANAEYVDGFKWHGLAVSAPTTAKAVPWYSIDASTWMLRAAFGKIFIRDKDINISDDSPRIKNMGQHYVNMTQRDELQRYIASKGFDAERLRVEGEQRVRWNIQELKEVFDGNTIIGTQAKQEGLF